jgi:hypothetical protein
LKNLTEAVRGTLDNDAAMRRIPLLNQVWPLMNQYRYLLTIGLTLHSMQQFPRAWKYAATVREHDAVPDAGSVDSWRDACRSTGYLFSVFFQRGSSRVWLKRRRNPVSQQSSSRSFPKV